MKKKDILLDVDEVIVFSGFVEAVNDFLGTHYTVDEFEDYYIDSIIPNYLSDRFNRFLNSRNLYANPHLLPNSIETIKKLSNYYNIYLLTSCINNSNIEGSSRIFIDKYNFLIKYLPFIDPKNFIFTGTKHLFKADIKIDDLITNFTTLEDIKLKILFPSYHNKTISEKELKEKNIIRAGYDWRTGWKEVETILMEELEKDKTKCLKKLP